MGFLPVIQKAARGFIEFLQELVQVGAPKSGVPSLSERLTIVADQVGYLQKDGRNSGVGGGYKFISHDAVVDAVGIELVKAGVVFGASITSHEIVATGSKDKNSNPVFRTFVFTKYSFSCTDTNEVREYPWMGDALDSLDKGLYKAITQSKKTFLLNFFLIATGDAKADADQYTPDYKGQSRDKAPTRANQPTAQPKGNGQPADPDSAARAEVVARIRKIAVATDGKSIDWNAISNAVSTLHGAGPFDPAKPGFQGWSLKQLNDLAWQLADGEDDSPAGGTDQWR